MSQPHSRIGGRGALQRSLRGLLYRVERFGEHRARTDPERRGTTGLHDQLTATFAEATVDEGVPLGLLAYAQRRRIARKTPELYRTETGRHL